MTAALTRLAAEIARYRHVSYDGAERLFMAGAMSERCWRIYSLFWEWVAPRLGGPAGLSQDMFCMTHGRSAYRARVNRFRVALGLEVYQ